MISDPLVGSARTGHLSEAAGRDRRLAITGGFALAAAAAALFFVSRGKWSDALIDSGNVWMVPFEISRGALLYRDLVYWFGPFTPYFHGMVFRFLGPTFSALVVAGILGSVATIAALGYAIRRVASRREALLWSAFAIPALVFMPNSGGAILGMGYRMWHAATFALLAVAVLVGPRETHRARRALLAGGLAGLAGLCRTEWGLATLLVTVLVAFRGEEQPRPARRAGLAVAAGFILVFGGVFTLFGFAAGWPALLEDAPVFLFNLPAETRAYAASSGASGWPDGVWTLLYSAAIWLAVFVLTEIVALRKTDASRARLRLPLLAALLGVFAAAAWGGGALAGGLVWSAAPLVCAVSCVVGLRSGRGPIATALFGFGLSGLLLSHRRFFFIGDGPYVGPPLMFALVCAAGLASMAVSREPTSANREKLEQGVTVLLGLLIGAAFAVRLVEYSGDDRVAIRGTAGLLSSRAELAREIEDLTAAIRAGSSREGLVVLPEGEVLNFLTGRRNPIRHKLYLPGYVNARNEGEIVTELQRAAPGDVVIWRRSLGEYGSGPFGESYGRRIRRWIDQNYDRQPIRADAPEQPSFEHYVRRAPAR